MQPIKGTFKDDSGRDHSILIIREESRPTIYIDNKQVRDKNQLSNLHLKTMVFSRALSEEEIEFLKKDLVPKQNMMQ